MQHIKLIQTQLESQTTQNSNFMYTNNPYCPAKW
jgi:hypothetical protein